MKGQWRIRKKKCLFFRLILSGVFKTISLSIEAPGRHLQFQGPGGYHLQPDLLKDSSLRPKQLAGDFPPELGTQGAQARPA